MKQWLYNGWCAFRAWVLFNYWRYLTNEDANELRKFYYLKRWEKRAMNRYVEDISSRTYTEIEDRIRYIGTINPEKMMNASLEKKNE
jgi:hypothetical protein